LKQQSPGSAGAALQEWLPVAANILAPSGFREGRLFNASAPNYAMTTRFIAYNYGSNIGFGDPVYLFTDGTIRLYAAAGTTIDGIFLGCQYFDPNHPSEPPFRPAWLAPTLASGTIVRAMVSNDPMMKFYAQAQGTAITQASVGKNLDIKSGTSGQPVTGSGMSTCALDVTTLQTTATLPFRLQAIVGLNDGAGVAINAAYNPTSDNQWLEVTLNTQDMTTRTGQA